MEPSQFFFLILPLAIIIAVLVVVVFYLSRRTEDTDYEKEMKALRQAPNQNACTLQIGIHRKESTRHLAVNKKL